MTDTQKLALRLRSLAVKAAPDAERAALIAAHPERDAIGHFITNARQNLEIAAKLLTGELAAKNVITDPDTGEAVSRGMACQAEAIPAAVAPVVAPVPAAPAPVFGLRDRRRRLHHQFELRNSA